MRRAGTAGPSPALRFLAMGVLLQITGAAASVCHKTIAAAQYHTCVILENGTVKCWGANNYGQLGYGDQKDRGDANNVIGDLLPAVALGSGRTAVSVAGGANHTCALLDDATVKCWGLNDYGQLGYGDQTNRGDGIGLMGDKLGAVDLGSGRKAVSISAGDSNTCAVLDDATLKCWGQNEFGQLGIGNTETQGDGQNEMGDTLAAVRLGAGRTARSVSQGAGHTCAVLDNRSLKCWGRNGAGQLGYGDQTNRGASTGDMGENLAAVDLGSGRTAVSVSANAHASCAVLDNGTVKCWGCNFAGQLGYGDQKDRGDANNEMGDTLPAVDLGTGRTAVLVAGGARHNCALLDDATVKCWGWNSAGQLGTGDVESRGDVSGEMGDTLAAVRLGAGRTALSFSAGFQHTCALLDNLAVKCWGVGDFGQLGYKDAASRGFAMLEMGDSLPAVALGLAQTVLRSGPSVCGVCPVGSFFTLSTCRLCRAGTYSGSLEANTCLPCPAGTFSTQRGASLSTTCTPCRAGRSSSEGSGQATDCVAARRAPTVEDLVPISFTVSVAMSVAAFDAIDGERLFIQVAMTVFGDGVDRQGSEGDPSILWVRVHNSTEATARPAFIDTTRVSIGWEEPQEKADTRASTTAQSYGAPGGMYTSGMYFVLFMFNKQLAPSNITVFDAVYQIGARRFTWPPPPDVIAAGEEEAAGKEAGEGSDVGVIVGIAAAVLVVVCVAAFVVCHKTKRVANVQRTDNEGFGAVARMAAWEGVALEKELEDAWAVLEAEAMCQALEATGQDQPIEEANKFQVAPKDLEFGKSNQAALGLEAFMGVGDEEQFRSFLGQGVQAIEEEIARNGTDEDKECLQYVLYQEAGKNQGGLKRDCDAFGNMRHDRQVPGPTRMRGMHFKDFCDLPNCKLAGLKGAQVLAVRLYTTKVFQSINDPLRDQHRHTRTEPHPLPATVFFLQDAVKKLRAVMTTRVHSAGSEMDISISASASSSHEVILWRGLKDVQVPQEFVEIGGTEFAPMSTTTDVKTALMFSAGGSSVLFRLCTTNPLKRGADISFLSAFPEENEILFPPLTFLAPIRPPQEIRLGTDKLFIVLDVEPILP